MRISGLDRAVLTARFPIHGPSTEKSIPPDASFSKTIEAWSAAALLPLFPGGPPICRALMAKPSWNGKPAGPAVFPLQ
jgi:hypothetical protein